MFVHVTPIESLHALRAVWQQLAVQAPHSFYLSWHWIGTWLRCLPPSVNPSLLSVSNGNVTIALAVLVKSRVTFRPLLTVDAWVLNATGRPELDCICTEYNGLLLHEQHSQEAWQAVLGYMEVNQDGWDEIHLHGVPRELMANWKDRGRPVREVRADTSRFVDLDEVRAASAGSNLALVSRKTRWTIRKTRKSLEQQHGPISTQIAGTLAEARYFLNELRGLHRTRWPNSDFSTSFATQFHDRLVGDNFDSGVVQLARVRAGEVTVGLVYSFVYGGSVLVYQTGFNYAVAGQGDSIGLMTHSELIDVNAALGLKSYDLMAGNSPYKRALTSKSRDLWWGALQASRGKLRAEAFVRSMLRAARQTFRGTNRKPD